MKRTIIALALVLCAAPQAFASLKGSVFNEGGAPIAHAAVSAHRPQTREAQAQQWMAGAPPAALATTRTAEDGTFALDTKAEGILVLQIDMEGYAPQSMLVLDGRGGVMVALEPAARRTGRVTADGKPLAGALVIDERHGRFWSATTDEQGRYTLPDPARWTTSLIVWHRDYAPQTIDATKSLDVALVRGVSVAGRVTGANGRPVAGARVSAGRWNVATSGEDGSFTLAHVPAKANRIVASAGSLHGSSARNEKELTILMQEGATISGTVRDPEKRPLAGAIIQAYFQSASANAEPRMAISDARGHYSIAHCDAKEHYLMLSDVADLQFEEARADLRRRPRVQQDFTATRKRFARGRVVDEANRPVAGAAIQLSTKASPLFYATVRESPTARSGADGRFELALPAESMQMDALGLRLQAVRAGYAVAASEPLGDLSKEATITLPKGIAVDAIVTDEQGTPIPNTAILLVQDPVGGAPMPFEGAIANGLVRPLFITDSNGRVPLRVNPRPHDLGVWRSGFAGFRQGDWTPRSGAPLRIVLEKGVEIRGRVVAKGTPRALDGTITATSMERSFSTGTVGANGAFVLEALTPGMYELSYSGASTADPQMVEAPATDVVIELPATGEIRGRVVDRQNGRPLTRYSIDNDRFTGEGRFFPDRAEVDSFIEVEGEETFQMVAPVGEIKLRARSEGYIAEWQTVAVESEKTAEVTIALSRGRSISGRVTSAGVPLSDASIQIAAEDFIEPDSSDANGEFMLNAAPRDAVTLRVTREGYLGKRVTVDAGTADARVDVELSPGTRVQGRVVTANGAPVAGAIIWAHSSEADTESQQATSGDDGSFQMEGLSPASYSFQASHKGHGKAQVENVMPGAEPVVITMRPPSATGTLRGTVRGFKDGGWMYGVVYARTGEEHAGLIGRDGSYEVENVPAGEVEVQAQAMSGGAQATTGKVVVNVPPDGEALADLAFRTDITVRGIVTEDARPLPGRQVSYSNSEGQWSATTNGEGAYRIVAIEPGQYDVAVSVGQTSFQTRYEVKGSGTFDIRIEYDRIEGRVTETAGAPIAGADITAQQENRSAFTARSDTTGAFRLSVAKGAGYAITVTKDGYATVAQRADSGDPPLHITMTRAEGLRVRLLDAASGKSLDGYVVATDAAGFEISKTSGKQKDGTHLVPLAPGAYRISVSASGFASQSVRTTVPLPSAELQLRLTPGGTLIVTTDRQTTDVVKLIRPDGEEYVRCECNGIAEIRLTGKSTKIEHVAPGQYTMNVLDQEGHVLTSVPVLVMEGQTATAAIHVPE